MTAQANDERSEIEDLLPWHAAGTLSPRDAKRVEDVLARDAELARRYALVRDEMSDTIQLNELLGAPSSRALNALLAKIDAEPARARKFSFNVAERLGSLFAVSPRAYAWSAGAAALLIVLQGALIFGLVQSGRSTGGYQTASAPAAAATDGHFAMIAFTPQVNAGDITRFLTHNKLTIVGGPNAGTGMFQVKIADADSPKEEVAQLIRRLQGNTDVVAFIAPTN